MARPDGRFHPARLVAHRDAGGGLTRVTIETDRALAATHTSPGQYVELRTDDESGFFVLANEPGAASWDLVMRAGGGAADVLLAKRAGSPLELSSAIGPGFPMDAVRTHPLVLALGGTGIAAGPPVMNRRIVDGDAARTSVFLGIRTRSELSMRDLLESWMAAGAQLVVCLSQDEGGAIDGIPHAHGYVQDVLRSAGPSYARRVSAGDGSGHIFAVGMASMIEALRAIAPELGIPPERVHTNH